MELRVRPPRRGLGLTSSDLNDLEWRTIEPLLPKARGIKRVDDRRVLNGILWRLRTGRSWASIPERYGPSGTCHARFVRWRDAGLWSRIVHAVSDVRGGRLKLIDAATAHVPPCYPRTPIVANDVVAWLGCA
jgi:transposase